MIARELLEFEDISFSQSESRIRVRLYRNFYFDMEGEALKRLGNPAVIDGSIEVENPRRLDMLLDSGFNEMRNSISGNFAKFISRRSGIPLIGSGSFGIVDRNSSLIEVKPITGCNLNCIFCSVDEGPSTRKIFDYVVDYSYIVEELAQLLEFKKCRAQVYINAHGEPTLYSPLPKLVKGIAGLGVDKIIMNTNGLFLHDKLLQELAEAGLSRINLSLNAVTPEMARKLSGTRFYNVELVKQAAFRIAEHMELLIAPVLLPGINDSEMPEIVRFAKSVSQQSKKNVMVGIQNFLNYERGRNPVKALGMQEFYARLRAIGKETGVNLMLDTGDFGIEPTEKLPKPFRKGQIVEAAIVCNGRYPSERLAVAGNRNILVRGCMKKEGSIVRLKLLRDKHNIFLGKEA